MLSEAVVIEQTDYYIRHQPYPGSREILEDTIEELRVMAMSEAIRYELFIVLEQKIRSSHHFHPSLQASDT